MFKKQKEEDILYLLTTNKIFLIKWVKGPKAMEGNQPHSCNLTQGYGGRLANFGV